MLNWLNPQSVFCINTTTFFLPSHIWILFEIHKNAIGASAPISAGAPRRLSDLPICCRPELFYILHNRNNKIDSDGFLFIYYLYFTPVHRYLYLSVCLSQNTWPTASPHQLPAPPKPPKVKHHTAREHSPTQQPTHPKTTTILAAEYNGKSSWGSDSTAFERKIMEKMVWKEGGGLGNYWQGTTNNLIAYCLSGDLCMVDTTDLHSNLGW